MWCWLIGHKGTDWQTQWRFRVHRERHALQYRRCTRCGHVMEMRRIALGKTDLKDSVPRG